MVKLNRIYTKSGDDGSTALGAGGRVSKAGVRVEAYGAVDELNAVLGMAIVACGKSSDEVGGRVSRVLLGVQQDLFDLGADLCVPVEVGKKGGEGVDALRVTPDQTVRLEGLIDDYLVNLEDLTSFVLPGGSEASAALHVARTVCRRAERVVVALREADGAGTGVEPQRYLNRLGDLLFVLARTMNLGVGGDTMWEPGTNREDSREDK